MAHQVKLEKTVAKPASDVFRALKEGRLFYNCGGDSNLMKIDFRVGGKYHIDFKNHGVVNFGEFLEIIPDKKIVFSWCQTFGENQKPDTQVTIELFPEGAKTRLVLAHTGFNDKSTCDSHYEGWNGGLTDLFDEMEKGRLRLVRSYKSPVATLFDLCKNSEKMQGFMGSQAKFEVLDVIPNQQITLSWLRGCGGPLKGSQVIMKFKEKNGGSSVELLHEGLPTEEDQVKHRAGWDMVTGKMSQILG